MQVGARLGLWVGLLQFVVAPMSLVVCAMRFGTNGIDCALHYAVNAAVGCVLALLSRSPHFEWLDGCLGKVSFSAATLGLFLALDFALNVAVYCSASERFGPARLAKHVLYGSFNTKTYFVVVFGALASSRLELDVLAWLLTGLATMAFVASGAKEGLLRRLRLPSFPILFYTEHRLNHCPVVYQHAHKMHHYLHDTTPFDAHIYGSGMNEEFAWIMAETLPLLLLSGLSASSVSSAASAASISSSSSSSSSSSFSSFLGLLAPYAVPFFANLDTLHMSWTNKGGHTNLHCDVSDAVNVMVDVGFDDEQEYEGPDTHAQHTRTTRTHSETWQLRSFNNLFDRMCSLTIECVLLL